MKKLIQTAMVFALLLLSLTGCSDLTIQRVPDPFATSVPAATEPPSDLPDQPAPTEPNLSVVGQWYTEIDVSQALWASLEESMDAEFEAPSGACFVTLCLEFKEGDRFKASMQMDDEELESLMDEVIEIAVEYAYAMAEEEGISREELDQLCKQQYGVGLDTYMKLMKMQAVTMMKEELNDSVANGYYVVEGNLLYTADTKKELEKRENCLEISVEENKLWLVGKEDLTQEDEEMMEMMGVEFPWAFDRQYSF